MSNISQGTSVPSHLAGHRRFFESHLDPDVSARGLSLVEFLERGVHPLWDRLLEDRDFFDDRHNTDRCDEAGIRGLFLVAELEVASAQAHVPIPSQDPLTIPSPGTLEESRVDLVRRAVAECGTAKAAAKMLGISAGYVYALAKQHGFGAWRKRRTPSVNIGTWAPKEAHG